MCSSVCRIVAGVASVQLLPLYGLLHPLHVTLPGAVDLSNGHVPWLSYGCSLASPWLISAFSVDYRVSAVSAAVILIVFGALTLHWLGSAKDRAAVILSLIGNAAVLTVRRHRVFLFCTLVCFTCLPIGPSRLLF